MSVIKRKITMEDIGQLELSLKMARVCIEGFNAFLEKNFSTHPPSNDEALSNIKDALQTVEALYDYAE